MAKKSIADASAELYKLLEPFEREERARIVSGTLTLLGDAGADTGSMSPPFVPQSERTVQHSQTTASGAVQFGQARRFFDQKGPQGTSERLATAARFFETHGGVGTMHKSDFAAVFEGARRDFTVSQFSRDMDNAIRAGYFNSGGGREKGYTLSHYGQDYVEALPDRAAAKLIQRPKRSGKGKRRRKAA